MKKLVVLLGILGFSVLGFSRVVYVKREPLRKVYVKRENPKKISRRKAIKKTVYVKKEPSRGSRIKGKI